MPTPVFVDAHGHDLVVMNGQSRRYGRSRDARNLMFSRFSAEKDEYGRHEETLLAQRATTWLMIYTKS